MSHFKEREEKNCLNCNARVHGKYCHVCGQENIYPRETFWHLVSHFFQDITHFDGKFFSTLKLLITKPGFISREYMMGRRVSYLNPIRMYVFTSAIFFLIFFSVVHVGKSLIDSSSTINKKTLAEIDRMDSTEFAKFTIELQETDDKEDSMEVKLPRKPMTRPEFQAYLDGRLDSLNTKAPWGKYKSKQQYDSALAAGKDHNWVERQFTYKMIALNEKYKGKGQLMYALSNELLHSLPQLIFVSLPIFAWLLYIMYARRRNFYYVNHAIFTIHFFVFVFINLLLVLGINELAGWLHWGWLSWVKAALICWIFIYCYKAMRNFYQQRRAKTIFKFLLLHVANLFVIIFLFVFFFFFSLFKM